MKRLFALAAAVIAVGGFVAPASAQSSTRVITQPGQIPLSTQDNIQKRFNQLGFGTWLRASLGSTLGSGLWSNVNVIPNGGMNVAVQPATAGTAGLLLQLGADDTNALPQNATPQLSADTTQVVLSGLQSGASGSIGPMSAPGAGTSQYYLLEAQLQQVDTNPQSIQFIASGGASSFATVNTYRVNQPTYQLKAGTAASSPTIPTADSGWFPVATILVPSGTATITSGMIAMVTSSQFQGFVANGATVTVSGLTLSGFGAGCLQTNSSGVVSSQPCTSGLGAVNGTTPIVSNTVTGTATVSCPTCVTSVSGGTGTSSTGGTTPSIALSHGDYLDQSSTAQTKTGALTTGAFTSTGNIAAGSASGTQISAGPAVVLQSTGSTSTNNALNLGFSGTNSGTISWYPNGLSNAAKGTLSSGGVLTATQFSGSGAGLTSGTVPNAALVTTPLDVSASAQTKSGALTVGGFTSTAGVNVGGALTGATTGSFSGSVATGALTAAGVNVGGALTGATTGTFSGNVTVGNGAAATSTVYEYVNGGNSGTTGGSALVIQNQGSNRIVLGNRSAVLGGAYDATPYLYTAGAGIVTDAGLTIGGALTGATTGAFSSSVTASAFSDGGSVATGFPGYAKVMVGNLNSATTAMTWGGTGNATEPSVIGAMGDTVSGVVGNTFEVGIRGVSALLSLDATGTLGLASGGSGVKVGSSTYGPTSAVVNGNITAGGSAANGAVYGGAFVAPTTASVYFENGTTGILGSFNNSKQVVADGGLVSGSTTVTPTSGIQIAGGTVPTAPTGGIAIGADGTNGAIRTSGTFYLNNAAGSGYAPMAAASITANGSVTATDRIYVGANARADVGGEIGIASSATSGRMWFGQSTSAQTWDYGVNNASYFTASAGIYAPSFNVSSRREWKTNIAPISPADSLAIALSAPVVQFCYNGKEPGGHDDGCKPGEERHTGVIANDLSSLVTGPKHDHFDATAGTAIAFGAIQALSAKVDALEKRDGGVRVMPCRTVVEKSWSGCLPNQSDGYAVPASAQAGPTLARLAAELDSIAYDNRVLRQRLSRLEHVRERVSPKKGVCPKGWVPLKRGKRVVGCTNATPSPRREAVKR